MVRRPGPDPGNAITRRLLRKLALVTYGLIAATVLAAAAAGALTAWLLQPMGLPYVETWVISGVLILAIPLAVHALRGRGGQGQR